MSEPLFLNRQKLYKKHFLIDKTSFFEVKMILNGKFRYSQNKGTILNALINKSVQFWPLFDKNSQKHTSYSTKISIFALDLIS